MTEQEQANGQIRIAEKQVHDIVENAGDAIIMIDECGVVEAFNAAAERLFGYGDGEVIGQNVRMLMPEPYNGDHDGHLAQYVPKGNSGGVETRREVAGRRKDGTEFPMDCAVSEMAAGEGERERKGFIGIVRDLTERKHVGEDGTGFVVNGARRDVGPDPAAHIHRFAVKESDNRISFLDVNEIDWIEGARDYVRLHSGARSHLVRSTMNSLSQKLDPIAFLRIHRSSIVRIDAIKELSPLFHGDYAVILHDGTELRLSRRYLRQAHGVLGFGF